MSNGIKIDWDRESRTGVAEAVLADSKSIENLRDILGQAIDREHPLLFTRISDDQVAALQADVTVPLDHDPVSRTMSFGKPTANTSTLSIGIVAAGTSDMPVAGEAQRALTFFGVENSLYADVGVAGLWRLTSIQSQLSEHAILIAVAGMEGALFSVLAGLTQVPIIAVPTSVGYGVSTGGHNALHSALGSCSPGIVTVNIDNGFGAAAAAKKFLHLHA